jgi:surfeit locus 1 family protein
MLISFLAIGPNDMYSLSVIPDFIFRKVLLKGKWDHEHSMLLGPRVRDGLHGYHLVTPLIRSDGSTVLVNRGFVSKEAIDKGKLQQETGEIEILGMLRTSQARNVFTPDNHPEKGQWYWSDVTAMSEFAGGAQAGVQPVFIEEIFGEINGLHMSITCLNCVSSIEGYVGEAGTRLSQGIPLGREPTVDVRNAHLSYVITW